MGQTSVDQIRMLKQAAVLLLFVSGCLAQAEPKMSDERVVFQTEYGDIEFGFYPEVRSV